MCKMQLLRTIVSFKVSKSNKQFKGLSLKSTTVNNCSNSMSSYINSVMLLPDVYRTRYLQAFFIVRGRYCESFVHAIHDLCSFTAHARPWTSQNR